VTCRGFAFFVTISSWVALKDTQVMIIEIVLNVGAIIGASLAN